MDTEETKPTPSGNLTGIPLNRYECHIPTVTIFRIFAAILLAVAIYKLWPLLLLVFVAILLAVTLHAMVAWLTARRIARPFSLLIVIGGLLTALGTAVAVALPALAEQLEVLSARWPSLQAELIGRFPRGSPFRPAVESLLESASNAKVSNWSAKFMTVGGMVFSGISQLVLMLMIAIYLVVDGGKTYRWLLAFFSPLTRRKMYHTAEETSQVFFGYVMGQVFTSGLIMVYTFTVLSVLQVPGALILAILAGLFDVLPMFGFYLLTLPAVLMALTVSSRTAIIVAGLYLIYGAIESYLIVPKVYGRSLRLSPLSVLLGLLVGSILAGIPGAIAALPLVASYAVVERIWLKDLLGRGVSEKHDLQKDQVFGEKG